MKQHTKATRTVAGTQVTLDEIEEMAFEEHQLIEVDNAARVYRYTDNGGVHYVAPMMESREEKQSRRFGALGGAHFFFGFINSAADRMPEVAALIEEALTEAERFEAESRARRDTLRAKAAQDAAFATYSEVQ